MQSESIAAAAPAAANTWTLVGNITVPAGAATLRKVKIGTAPDPGVAAATLHLAPVFRLTGSGIAEQSPHLYVAQGADLVLVAATTALVSAEPALNIFDVDIPVQTGGIITVEELSIAEAVPGTNRCELVFDSAAASGKNGMSDYVSHVMNTAADAWQTVGTLTVPQVGTGKSPVHIKRVDCGFVNDNLGAVTSLRTSTRFRLTGSGVNEGGLHHFLGNQNSGSNVVTGSGKYDQLIMKHDCDIPVNPGGNILVEAISDSELTDGGDYVFGVQYE